MAKLGQRKASKIAKRYVSALVTYFNGFHSELLSDDDNKLIQQECMKIALKLYDGENFANEDDIIKQELKSK